MRGNFLLVLALVLLIVSFLIEFLVLYLRQARRRRERDAADRAAAPPIVPARPAPRGLLPEAGATWSEEAPRLSDAAHHEGER